MNLEINSSKKILPLLFIGVLMGALDISIVGPANSFNSEDNTS